MREADIYGSVRDYFSGQMTDTPENLERKTGLLTSNSE